jgi:hypothetical protein
MVPVATTVILMVVALTYALCRRRLVTLAEENSCSMSSPKSRAAMLVVADAENSKPSCHQSQRKDDPTECGLSEVLADVESIGSELEDEFLSCEEDEDEALPAICRHSSSDKSIASASTGSASSQLEQVNDLRIVVEDEDEALPVMCRQSSGDKSMVSASTGSANSASSQLEQVNDLVECFQRCEAKRALCMAFGGEEQTAVRFLREASWESDLAQQRASETASWRAQTFKYRAAVKKLEIVPASLEIFARSGEQKQLVPCVGWDGGIYSCHASAATLPLTKASGWDGGLYNCHASVATPLLTKASELRPQWWEGCDGSPVEFWRMDRIDLAEIFSGRFTQEHIFNSYVEYNERRLQRINEVSASGFIVVIDAKGIEGIAFRKCMLYMRQASRLLGGIGERHYPGCVRAVIIFNASALVHTLYRALSPSLSESTRSVVTISHEPAHKVPELARMLKPGTLQEMQAALG